MQDLGYEGYSVTWSNGRREDNNIQCRLDREMSFAAGFNRLYPIQITLIHRFRSDYVVLRIELEKSMMEERRNRQFIFRFEDVWARDERCNGIVK